MIWFYELTRSFIVKGAKQFLETLVGMKILPVKWSFLLSLELNFHYKQCSQNFGV